MRHQLKPTTQDVANKAGVSAATVSRTFAHPDKVLQETREKVMIAARELGFTISRSASALKSQQSFRIAVLISEPVANWFNSHICGALNDVLQPEGYDICTYYIPDVTIVGNCLRRFHCGTTLMRGRLVVRCRVMEIEDLRRL